MYRKPAPGPSGCRPTRQAGFGLPFAIFVVVVLAFVGLAVTQLEETSSESVVFEVQSTRAFLAAESGMQIGLNRLLPPLLAANDCTHTYFNSTPSVTFSATGLDACTATVSCRTDNVDGNDYFTLTSTGSCGAGIDLATRVVQVGIR